MATSSSRGKLAGRKVHVFVNKGIKADTLNQTLDRIYRLSGCLGCGLLGYDIILHGGDPGPDSFDTNGLPGVGGVTIGG